MAEERTGRRTDRAQLQHRLPVHPASPSTQPCLDFPTSMVGCDKMKRVTAGHAHPRPSAADHAHSLPSAPATPTRCPLRPGGSEHLPAAAPAGCGVDGPGHRRVREASGAGAARGAGDWGAGAWSTGGVFVGQAHAGLGACKEPQQYTPRQPVVSEGAEGAGARLPARFGLSQRPRERAERAGPSGRGPVPRGVPPSPHVPAPCHRGWPTRGPVPAPGHSKQVGDRAGCGGPLSWALTT